MSPHGEARVAITPFEAAVVVTICFGLFIYGSVVAVIRNFPSQPFSDGDFSNLVVHELVVAMAALAFLGARGYAVRTLAPQPTGRGAALGAALFLGCWLVVTPMLATIASAIAPNPDQEPIERMVTEARLSLAAIVPMAIVNGVFEEVFLLAVLMRGLRRFGLSFALGAMLLVRLSYHLYQGPQGALSVLGFGVVLGLFYARNEHLWPPVVAHVLADIVPFALYSR